jgi:hypothetical protein
MKVLLISPPEVKSLNLISHGARACYEPEMPDLNGPPIDAKNRLWKVAHHTTFQHGNFTFFIEGISVGDVTLGLHLANVFYDSGQRSGRFCKEMFANPDIEGIIGYVLEYYDVSKYVPEIRDYLVSGYGVYGQNFERAAKIAKEFIRQERPFASEKYIEENGPKFAQEQLRMFIPVIFPTALEHSLDLSALAALYRNAWSPVLKDVTQKMADLVLEKNPEISFIFERADGDFPDIPVERSLSSDVHVHGRLSYHPAVDVVSLGNPDNFVIPEFNEMFPVDSLPFNPRFMNNNCEEFRTRVQISLATMGQDQRHRTVRRGKPRFTGRFYLPPVLVELGLQREAFDLMEKWEKLFENEEIPLPLACSLAPYGAMVRYAKSASYNALAHEMLKRLCWCAQEEIYHLSASAVSQIPEDSPLRSVMHAPCAMSGVCGEGKRCCGRDIKKSSVNTERKI